MKLQCTFYFFSCSPSAEKEHPNLDPTLISAVSIARRLQDPLSEFVKVDPWHLGVGMYQHDLPQIQLQNHMKSIVEECVSFVGKLVLDVIIISRQVSAMIHSVPQVVITIFT